MLHFDTEGSKVQEMVIRVRLLGEDISGRQVELGMVERWRTGADCHRRARQSIKLLVTLLIVDIRY
jgi:hypothetical protein